MQIMLLQHGISKVSHCSEIDTYPEYLTWSYSNLDLFNLI